MNKGIKVYYINAVIGRGSTGNIVSNMANNLIENGGDYFIAYSKDPVFNIDRSKTIKIGNKIDYIIHNLLSRFTDKEGLYSKITTRKLIKSIYKFNPDIIHIHNIHGYWINYKILFKFIKKNNYKVLWTFHDCWPITGHCVHFDTIGCNQWKVCCKKCSQLGTYPKCYLFGRVKTNFNLKKEYFGSIKKMKILTPSYWLGTIVKESFLKKYDVIPLYNGVDLSIFKYTESKFKEKYGLSNNRIVLGVANVWSKEKGINEFAKLSWLLDDEFVIVLVGLKNIEGYNFTNNVICIDRTNNIDELVEIYSAADVFFNPSVQETMGMVTVEALACETPAIVYDKTAVPEIVDDYSGIVIKNKDIELVSKLINEKRYLDYIHGTRNRAMYFDKNRQLQKYIKILEEFKNEK